MSALAGLTTNFWMRSNLLKLAERLEDTQGFWENHLFPLDLNLMEAQASKQPDGQDRRARFSAIHQPREREPRR